MPEKELEVSLISMPDNLLDTIYTACLGSIHLYKYRRGSATVSHKGTGMSFYKGISAPFFICGSNIDIMKEGLLL